MTTITARPYRTGQTHLYIPGPTNIPESVRRATMVAMQDHRAPEFAGFVTGILRDLKPVLGTTEGQVVLFPGSGTGAWEAAITNTLSPGDRVLMARHGQFSALWAEMATRLGLEIELIDLAWGTGAPVAEFGSRLAADRKGAIRAVFVTHNETATGVTSDVAGVRRAMDDAHHDALLFVDGVSSIGSIPFEMDAWGVDLAVTGSQKGLMCPAGLGILGVSPKALRAMETATSRRAYFDLRDMLKTVDTGAFPYTPPGPLLHALRASLDRIADEGLEAIQARHARLAEGVRRAVAAWGMALCAEHPSLYSDTVTAIRVPDDVDAREVIRIANERWNCALGSGLARLAGRVFRIGHLGDLNEGMCLSAIAIAEMALVEAGAAITLGSGVAAAQSFYALGQGGAAARIAAE
jgi:alanine-glyoxylate transaminase / serine-glyoxylate transaminase / serine-pyruvate transaminase